MKIKKTYNSIFIETKNGTTIREGDYVNGSKVIDISFYYGLILERTNPNIKEGLKNEYINKDEDIKTITKKEEFDEVENAINN